MELLIQEVAAEREQMVEARDVSEVQASSSSGTLFRFG
jgi:hypothetical protein